MKVLFYHFITFLILLPLIQSCQANTNDNSPADNGQELSTVVEPLTGSKTAAGAPEPSLPDDGAVPFIEAVSTVGYLRSKGIEVINKETFEKPELVFDVHVDGPARPTDVYPPNENDIISVVVGDRYSGKDHAILYFDRDGNQVNRVEVGENECELSRGGNGTVLIIDDREDHRATLVYYDGMGAERWRKVISYSEWHSVSAGISYDGSRVFFAESYTDWEEEGLGPQDLDFTKLEFFDGMGNEIFSYDNCIDFERGEFSLDGSRFVCMLLWRSGKECENRLACIDLANGSVAWEKPYVGDYRGEWIAVSETGGYVAVVDGDTSNELRQKLKDENPDYYKHNDTPTVVSVFDGEGKEVARVRSWLVTMICDNGILSARVGHKKLLVDFTTGEVISTYTNSTPVVDKSTSAVTHMGESGYGISPDNFLIITNYVLDSEIYYRITDLDEDVCWDTHEASFPTWSRDGRYLLYKHPRVQVRRVKRTPVRR